LEDIANQTKTRDSFEELDRFAGKPVKREPRSESRREVKKPKKKTKELKRLKRRK